MCQASRLAKASHTVLEKEGTGAVLRMGHWSRILLFSPCCGIDAKSLWLRIEAALSSSLMSFPCVWCSDRTSRSTTLCNILITPLHPSPSQPLAHVKTKQNNLSKHVMLLSCPQQAGQVLSAQGLRRIAPSHMPTLGVGVTSAVR